MASSFSSQIPAIIFLMQKLNPKRVLDIGKGFGKYGFLLHEYVGINNKNKLDPLLTMAQQSNIIIDAIEVDKDLILPHLHHFYSNVFFGDVFEIYKDLLNYDLILMIDVIEHLDKAKAINLVKEFLQKKAHLIIATPTDFFQQELYQSSYEHHVSHWVYNDFKKLGSVEYQHFEGGAVYLLSNNKINVRGFGNSVMKKIRRIGRLIKNEMY